MKKSGNREDGRHPQPAARGRARGGRAVHALLVPGLRLRPHSDRVVAARAGRRIAPARAAGRRVDHDAWAPIRRSRSGRCSTRTRPTSRRCCASRSTPSGRRSASTASCSTPCRRLGRARGVRAPDDPRRGAARRRGRQDAEEARRRRGVRSASGLSPCRWTTSPSAPSKPNFTMKLWRGERMCLIAFDVDAPEPDLVGFAIECKPPGAKRFSPLQQPPRLQLRRADRRGRDRRPLVSVEEGAVPEVSLGPLPVRAEAVGLYSLSRHQDAHAAATASSRPAPRSRCRSRSTR